VYSDSALERLLSRAAQRGATAEQQTPQAPAAGGAADEAAAAPAAAACNDVGAGPGLELVGMCDWKHERFDEEEVADEGVLVDGACEVLNLCSGAGGISLSSVTCLGSCSTRSVGWP
jgi:hypothetical protein